jgi:starch phosphorylase
MEGGLRNLREIAGNLWFSWNTDAVDLFDHLDEHLWQETNHNPQQVIIRLSRGRLGEILEDDGFLAYAEKVTKRFRAYMERERAYEYRLDEAVKFPIAYFSMEYGITECLPLYSGGLGLTAGDHLKSAADLNLPMIGIGLMFREGYFNQKLTPDGWQQEVYVARELDTLPLTRLTDESGAPLRVSVEMGGETLWARLLKAEVGTVPLILLDADLPENPPHLREVTARLYGGDMETRIRQEILLGVGGVRALAAMNIKPAVHHLNGAQGAFAVCELIRRLVQDAGLAIDDAAQLALAKTVFTLHGSHPSGDDVFDRWLMGKYFGGFASSLGVDFEKFLGWGRTNPDNYGEGFSMGALALRMSASTYAVSKLHRALSLERRKAVWPSAVTEDVPIAAITNGVHIPSYLSRDMAVLYDRYLGPGWNEDPDNEKVWKLAEKIPDAELWRTHERCRSRLVQFVRRRLARQNEERGASPGVSDRLDEPLDPEALTICLAGRVDVHRRANLLLRDPDRLAAIVNDPERPVQFILAGKAHPSDNSGKEVIQGLVRAARNPIFRNRIVFIDDFDIDVARYMVQGADVWLNTPRRPFESCGSSGMKAAANGGLNLSVLDGWWDEGYREDNGWAIGLRESYQDPAYQDDIESRALYDLLEESVMALFYERGANDLPRDWILMMKRSLVSLCAYFNSHRMVSDYVETAYIPAARNVAALEADGYAELKRMASWRESVRSRWDAVKVLDVQVGNGENPTKGKEIEVTAIVDSAGHSPEELHVALIHGPIDLWDNFKVRLITRLKPEPGAWDGSSPVKFSERVLLSHTGLYGYQIRITPEHPNLAPSQRFSLVHWA